MQSHRSAPTDASTRPSEPAVAVGALAADASDNRAAGRQMLEGGAAKRPLGASGEKPDAAIFPTATEDVLGQGKWQAGPAALAVRLGKEHGGLGIENWNIGALVQQWWSYAGDSDRGSTDQMDIQYFLNWKMNATQLIGMTPNIRINWNADSGERLSLPAGLGTIGMFKVGRLPFRWGVEVHYYVIQPDAAGPEWNFKVFLAPIILNPFK